ERLTVGRRGRVEVDELADPVARAVGDTGDHHAAVAVPDEDHVAQVFELQQRDDVADVEVEVDVGAHEVRAFAETGERRRVDIVTRRDQEPNDARVAPPAVPTAVNQDVRRHRCVSPYAPSRCSSITPDGVPPPEVTTAVLAFATWRSPASWRSCVIAS